MDLSEIGRSKLVLGRGDDKRSEERDRQSIRFVGVSKQGPSKLNN